MAKRKKIKPGKVISENIPDIEGKKKLKVGQQVLYTTPYLMDKAEVESINIKDKTAILTNQVKVSLGVNSDGTLNKIGIIGKELKIMTWSEEVEVMYLAYLAKNNISTKLETIKKSIKNISDEDLINIDNKLSKIINKYIQQ